jgi:hypothetical protein
MIIQFTQTIILKKDHSFVNALQCCIFHKSNIYRLMNMFLVSLLPLMSLLSIVVLKPYYCDTVPYATIRNLGNK